MKIGGKINNKKMRTELLKGTKSPIEKAIVAISLEGVEPKNEEVDYRTFEDEIVFLRSLDKNLGDNYFNKRKSDLKIKVDSVIYEALIEISNKTKEEVLEDLVLRSNIFTDDKVLNSTREYKILKLEEFEKNSLLFLMKAKKAESFREMRNSFNTSKDMIKAVYALSLFLRFDLNKKSELKSNHKLLLRMSGMKMYVTAMDYEHRVYAFNKKVKKERKAEAEERLEKYRKKQMRKMERAVPKLKLKYKPPFMNVYNY